MKHKKITKKIKKRMFAGTFDPNADSRYARKKRLQGRVPCQFTILSRLNNSLQKGDS